MVRVLLALAMIVPAAIQAQYDGQWKIVHVLWQSAPGG